MRIRIALIVSAFGLLAAGFIFAGGLERSQEGSRNENRTYRTETNTFVGTTQYNRNSGKGYDATVWYNWSVAIVNEESKQAHVYCDIWLLDSSGNGVATDIGEGYIAGKASGFVRGEDFMDNNGQWETVASATSNCKAYFQ